MIAIQNSYSPLSYPIAVRVIKNEKKQASGFAEEVLHPDTAFFETLLGHRFLYDGKLRADVNYNQEQ